MAFIVKGRMRTLVEAKGKTQAEADASASCIVGIAGKTHGGDNRRPLQP